MHGFDSVPAQFRTSPCDQRFAAGPQIKEGEGSGNGAPSDVSQCRGRSEENAVDAHELARKWGQASTGYRWGIGARGASEIEGVKGG